MHNDCRAVRRARRILGNSRIEIADLGSGAISPLPPDFADLDEIGALRRTPRRERKGLSG
jgi:hypothetical protein